MWLVLGIGLSWLTSVLENFFNGWLPINVAIGLVFSITFYLTASKKIGLVMLVSWALWQDVLYNPWLPVSVISILFSWWLWKKFVDARLAPLGYLSLLASASLWFALYFIIHWLVSWLPFWLNDSVLYPGAGTRWWLLVWGWLASLFALALFLGILRSRQDKVS